LINTKHSQWVKNNLARKGEVQQEGRVKEATSTILKKEATSQLKDYTNAGTANPTT